MIEWIREMCRERGGSLEFGQAGDLPPFGGKLLDKSWSRRIRLWDKIHMAVEMRSGVRLSRVKLRME